MKRSFWKVVTLLSVVSTAMFTFASRVSAEPVETISSPTIDIGLYGFSQSNSTLSEDGRYLLTSTDKSSTGVTYPDNHIFLYDLETKQEQIIDMRPDGTLGNADALYPKMTADNRYVFFVSPADNLYEGQFGANKQVWRRDLETGTIIPVSASNEGALGDNHSDSPIISGDGRFVAFHSTAENLVPGITSIDNALFIRDIQSGTTEVISPAVANQYREINELGRMSYDGRYIVYESEATDIVPGDTNNSFDVFLYDQETDLTKIISLTPEGDPANGMSQQPVISADGRYIVYHSNAANLVDNDTNGLRDIFLYDNQTGDTKMISRLSDGTQLNALSSNPTISPNGRFIAFQTSATNFLENNLSGNTRVIVYDQFADMFYDTSRTADTSYQEYNMFMPNSVTNDGRVLFHSDFNIFDGTPYSWGESFYLYIAKTMTQSIQLLDASIEEDTLTLNFDTTLNENMMPNISDFRVTVNGHTVEIIDISIVDSSVILTLENPVQYGDVISLSFMNTDGNLRDLYLNPASSFEDMDVLNLTEEVLPITGATLTGAIGFTMSALIAGFLKRKKK